MAAVHFTYTCAVGEVIPREATHVTVINTKVVPVDAFRGHPNIVEIVCHEDVEKVEKSAFQSCPSLRRVVMPGVTVVEGGAFIWSKALTHVECGKLEIIKGMAFVGCESLRSINLESARILEKAAFLGCEALTGVKFGSKLEKIEEKAFTKCKSLEQITIPLRIT